MLCTYNFLSCILISCNSSTKCLSNSMLNALELTRQRPKLKLNANAQLLAMCFHTYQYNYINLCAHLPKYMTLVGFLASRFYLGG